MHLLSFTVVKVSNKSHPSNVIESDSAGSRPVSILVKLLDLIELLRNSVLDNRLEHLKDKLQFSYEIRPILIAAAYQKAEQRGHCA